MENYAVVERLRVHFHTRPQSADRRNRQRQIHRGGRSGPAARRPRLGRDGSHRRIAGARSGHLRCARPYAHPPRSWSPRASRPRTANCWWSAKSWPAASRAPLWAAVPWRPRCSKNWRRTWPISTASTISSFCFLPDAQRDMLDAFAGHAELLAEVAATYGQWRAAAAELDELERSEQEKLRLLDLWTFQRKEIEARRAGAGRGCRLENQRRVLQNVQRLEEAAAGRLRRRLRQPRIRPGPGPHRRPQARRALPDRLLARPSARASPVRRAQPPGSRLRPARLPLPPGCRSRPPGRDRNPPRLHRPAEAQVRHLHPRNLGLPRPDPRPDRPGGKRRRAHGGVAPSPQAPGRRI